MAISTLRPLLVLAMLLLATPPRAFSEDPDWNGLGTQDQERADAAIHAFLEARLSALRNQVSGTPCRLSLLESQPVEDRWKYSTDPAPAPKDCRATWDARDQQFVHRWRSGTVENKRRNAVRADWEGNFDRVIALLEQKLQPLEVRKITPYFPYGWYEPVPGAELLLRDGRTLLGVSRAGAMRDGGKGYEAYLEFHVFDVRRLPGPGRWVRVVNTHRFDDADQAQFGVRFTPTEFAAIAAWEKGAGIGREIDLRVLDPSQVGEVRVAPELQALGRELAARRWGRLAYMAEVMTPRVRQQHGNARTAERQYEAQARRHLARQEAAWSRAAAESRPQTNAIAAGVAEGLANAARTQQFWNARAAEAQAMYFQAQHGCRPGFCGAGKGDTGPRGSSEDDASASGPNGTAKRTAGSSGSSGGDGPAVASGGIATASPAPANPAGRPTYFRWGKNTSAGSQRQACSAARAPDRALGGPLTGNVASDCDCKNPGAEWQREIDEARRKLAALEPGSFAPQRVLYTDKIKEREGWIQDKAWVCRANFEIVGMDGAPTR